MSATQQRVNMQRILACVTLERGEIESWPAVRTWATERGELVAIEEGEAIRLLLGHFWVTQPKYVLSVLEETYGVPNKMVGPAALQYLAHRFPHFE